MSIRRSSRVRQPIDSIYTIHEENENEKENTLTKTTKNNARKNSKSSLSRVPEGPEEDEEEEEEDPSTPALNQILSQKGISVVNCISEWKKEYESFPEKASTTLFSFILFSCQLSSTTLSISDMENAIPSFFTLSGKNERKVNRKQLVQFWKQWTKSVIDDQEIMMTVLNWMTILTSASERVVRIIATKCIFGIMTSLVEVHAKGCKQIGIAQRQSKAALKRTVSHEIKE